MDETSSPESTRKFKNQLSLFQKFEPIYKPKFIKNSITKEDYGFYYENSVWE